MEQMEYSDMLVLVLPSLLNVIQHCSTDDYKETIQPEFRKVFTMTRPVQVWWQNSNALLTASSKMTK